jgi:hypothetical protein
MSGIIWYCEVPRSAHGKPLRKRACSISSATHEAAANRHHPLRLTQSTDDMRRAESSNEGEY